MPLVVLPRRPGTCYPLTPLGVFVYPVAGENTCGMCCCVTTPTYLLQWVFLQEPAQSLCVFLCMHINEMRYNLWANIPVQSSHHTAVNEGADDELKQI